MTRERAGYEVLLDRIGNGQVAHLVGPPRDPPPYLGKPGVIGKSPRPSPDPHSGAHYRPDCGAEGAPADAGSLLDGAVVPFADRRRQEDAGHDQVEWISQVTADERVGGEGEEVEAGSELKVDMFEAGELVGLGEPVDDRRDGQPDLIA